MSFDRSCRGHLRGGGPHLLYLGQGGSKAPSAPWMVANAATVRAAPLDGVFFQIDASSLIMGSGNVSLASIQSNLAGLSTADFAHCTHNMPVLYMESIAGGMPQDMDWTNNSIWATITQNWANLAQACAGNPNIVGILLDNEPYSGGWNGTTHPFPFDYRADLNPAPYNTTDGPGIFDASVAWATARDQVHARGKQIMDAVIAQWPDVRVMFLHGAYISFTDTLAETAPTPGNDVAFVHELSAVFMGGFVEATAAAHYQAVVIDGGEKYEIHDRDGTLRLNRWRRKMPRVNTGAIFKPSAAATYMTDNAVGFMDFDVMEQFPNSPMSTPAEITARVGAIMQGVDTYAWLYCEGLDVLGVSQPQPSQAYMDAIASARYLGRGGGTQAGSSGANAYTHLGADTVALTDARSDTLNGGGGGGSDSFTGSDGAAWASPWTTSVGGTGGVVDIQGNRGRMVTPTDADLRAGAFYDMLSNGEVTVKASFPNPATTHTYINIAFRADDWSGDYDFPANGYYVDAVPNENVIYVYKWVASGATMIGSATFTFASGTDVWVKVRWNGSTIQCRAWNVGATEPPAWNVMDDTDTTFTTGKWGLSVSSATAGSKTAYWDDLSWIQV